MWYWLFKNALFTPVCKLAFRGWIKGEQNIPEHGGAILAANHIGTGETFLLPALIGRKVIYPVKAELFVPRKSVGSKVVAWFLKAVGQVPMDRSGGRASASGLSPVVEVLRDGGLAGIFPEGTRSVDGRLYKGKTGVARMALDAGVPVIPVGTINSDFKPGPLGIPWLHRPGVIVGAPLDFSEYAGRQDELKVLRHVTDQVMGAIQQLTGQEYVDVYGSRAKHGDLKEKDLSEFVTDFPGEGRPAPEPNPRD